MQQQNDKINIPGINSVAQCLLILRKFCLSLKLFSQRNRIAVGEIHFCFLVQFILLFFSILSFIAHVSLWMNYEHPILLFFSVLFRDIFNHVGIIIVLGTLILLLLYAFHCKCDYLSVLKALLFIQVLWTLCNLLLRND